MNFFSLGKILRYQPWKMLLGMEDEGELLFKMVAFSGGDAVIFGGFFVIPPKMPVQCGK